MFTGQDITWKFTNEFFSLDLGCASCLVPDQLYLFIYCIYAHFTEQKIVGTQEHTFYQVTLLRHNQTKRPGHDVRPGNYKVSQKLYKLTVCLKLPLGIHQQFIRKYLKVTPPKFVYTKQIFSTCPEVLNWTCQNGCFYWVKANFHTLSF